jgi:hypothetical protein
VQAPSKVMCALYIKVSNVLLDFQVAYNACYTICTGLCKSILSSLLNQLSLLLQRTSLVRFHFFASHLFHFPLC